MRQAFRKVWLTIHESLDGFRYVLRKNYSAVNPGIFNSTAYEKGPLAIADGPIEQHCTGFLTQANCYRLGFGISPQAVFT
jgi:hypothetical protein